jgi:hypothetical protein
MHGDDAEFSANAEISAASNQRSLTRKRREPKHLLFTHGRFNRKQRSQRDEAHEYFAQPAKKLQ